MRRTIAVTASPTASSICGAYSTIDSEPIRARSGISMAETAGGRISQDSMTATKDDFLSWKPTSTVPFFFTSRTDKRAR